MHFLREMIFALAGIPENLSSAFSQGINNYFHPEEIHLAQTLLSIANDYRYILDQTKKNRDLPFLTKSNHNNSGMNLRRGLYMETIYDTVYTAVLQPYQKHICALEEKLLLDEKLGLIFLVSETFEYQSILKGIRKFMDQITSQQLYGCQLLQYIYDNSYASPCYYVILKRCNAILLKQISQWLLHGELVDEFNEFFIRAIESDASASQGRNEGLECVPDGKYELLMDYVPDYIPHSLSNKIMFVGYVVKMILKRNPACTQRGTCISYEQEREYHISFSDLLKRQELDIDALGDLVDKIYAHVARMLMNYASANSQLNRNVALMRNVYLFGFQHFFDVLIAYTKSTTWKAEKLSDILDTISCSSQLKHLDYEDLEKIKITDRCHGNKSSPLKLSLDFEWPLTLIFTPSVMSRYNDIFSFCLRLRKCHISLNRIWLRDIKETKRTSALGSHAKLRMEMIFFINCLQYYIQMDVIQTEVVELLSQLECEGNFFNAAKLHNIFLSNILDHLFIYDMRAVDPDCIENYEYVTHPVSKTIMALVEACEKYCVLQKKNIHVGSTLNESNKSVASKEKEISAYFAEKMGMLCELLLTLQCQPFEKHLSKLFHKLTSSNNGDYLKLISQTDFPIA